MFENFDFLDKFETADNYIQNPKVLNLINSYNLDFIISPLGKNFVIEFLKSTNAKRIIVRNKICSIFSLKCKVVWHTFIRKFVKCSFEDELLYFYARKIDPKFFNSKIKSLNFDISIKTKEKHKEKIKAFLEQNGLKNFIIINPFYISTKYKLLTKDFIKLLEEIRKNTLNLKSLYPLMKLCIRDLLRR